jgi:hypothetical protein
MASKIELIESLLKEAKALSYNDGNIDKVLKRSEMISKKVFGEKTEYIEKLNKIIFTPLISFSGMSDSIYKSSFQNGKNELENLLNVMLEDLNLTDALDLSEKSENINSELSKNE